MDIVAWQATVHGVAKSWTHLSFTFSRWWKQVVIHKVLFYFAFFFIRMTGVLPQGLTNFW